jgi:hypothetical protein
MRSIIVMVKHVSSTNSIGATDFADFYMLAAPIHWCNLVNSANVLYWWVISGISTITNCLIAA